MKTGIRHHTIGELFCGPGGGGLGAKNASAKVGNTQHIFKHVWASDIDLDTCKTYSKNMFYSNGELSKKVVCGDARKLALEDVSIFPKVEGLLFGFPCNDFSLVGETKGVNGKYGPLYAQGIRKNLRTKLLELDSNLKATNPENRVYVCKDRYHGKMYITNNGESTQTLIGSSNFSKAGFFENLEVNYCHPDMEIYKEANSFFDYLKGKSVPITKINLPEDTKPALAVAIQPDAANMSIFEKISDYKLPIKITQRSNLNLFLSVGRLNSNTGIYTPRPFYEVELTLPKKESVVLSKYLPNQVSPAKFQATTDTGATFEVNFNSKTRNIPLHETGIDFMSSPRSALGHYIKGKLIRQGLLRFGEPVSEDILAEYGKNYLDVYFVGNGKMYIKF